VSGIGSMRDMRKYLINKGMTHKFVDYLAKSYILGLEKGNICRIMDLFE
jgi:hypothetical protein